MRHIGALAFVLVLGLGTPVHSAGFLDQLKGAVKEATTDALGSGGGSSSSLATDQIVAGLKEALRVGAEKVVGQLGAADGFNADPTVHIPLPESLQSVQSTLRKFGLSALADDVELKLNRAAEEATPKAKELLWKAVNEMTLDDAKKIYDGPDDAATRYFEKVASDDLRATVGPVVDSALAEVGALTAYDSLIGQYKAIPFVPDVKSDLKSHATQLTLDGIFHYLAQEEAAIRKDPAARTTDLLKQVFGKS